MKEDEEVMVDLVRRTEEKVTVAWCGGRNKGQDITVRLVRLALAADDGEDEHGGDQTLAIVKVHSVHLRRCSKYFDTCLSERWRDQHGAGSSSSSDPPEGGGLEFSLEVNADVWCYTDCFFRMYSPLRKDFQDVEYSLELLKVASQIEYHELMDFVSLYLSTIRWSDEDERRIREYSGSPDFSRKHAEDLVIRLGLDAVGEVHMKKVSKHTCYMTLWGITNALGDGDPLNFRKFVEQLLEGNLFGTVTEIIVLVAKNKLIELENNCQDLNCFVLGLERHVSGICWILRVLLRAGVAEDLVQCLMSSKSVAMYLSEKYGDVARAGWEMAQVVVQMYYEVVAGRLLLRTPERVALIMNWYDLLQTHLKKEDYYEATKNLFLTLPIENQVNLLESQQASFINFIDASSLATLVKKNCAAMGGHSRSAIEVSLRQEQARIDKVGDEDSRLDGSLKRRKLKRSRWGL